MSSSRLLSPLVIAPAVLVAGLAALPATAAQATPSAPTATNKQINAKAKRPFYRACQRSNRFNEHRFDYTTDAVLAGRCTTFRIKGVKLISSYSGHHPSANKALDIMVNMQGSCRAGRTTGNDVARYLMNHAQQHGIRYLIWKNSYWASTSKPTKFRNWRHGIAGGSCTTKHFDHVHAAFE